MVDGVHWPTMAVDRFVSEQRHQGHGEQHRSPAIRAARETIFSRGVPAIWWEDLPVWIVGRDYVGRATAPKLIEADTQSSNV